MSNDPPASSDESPPLPKATVPVQLAPPAEPFANAPPAQAQADAPPAEVDAIQQSSRPQADAPSAEAELAPPVASAAAAPAAEDKPSGFVPWLRSLSVLEKFCCGAILLGVIGFASLVFVPALYDFPEEPELMTSDDFPIQGAQVEVSSAETYWREAVLEGENADAVREGTALVPVFDAKLAGNGDVRILFRNGKGEVSGDLLSLKLSGDQDYAAAGTVGLNQLSEFEAYRAGETEAWVVEFHEVPASEESLSEETLLFEMNISPILK